LGRDLFGGKVPEHGAEHLLFFAEGKVHSQSS
jgi:hypothetical protein